MARCPDSDLLIWRVILRRQALGVCRSISANVLSSIIRKRTEHSNNWAINLIRGRRDRRVIQSLKRSNRLPWGLRVIALPKKTAAWKPHDGVSCWIWAGSSAGMVLHVRKCSWTKCWNGNITIRFNLIVSSSRFLRRYFICACFKISVFVRLTWQCWTMFANLVATCRWRVYIDNNPSDSAVCVSVHLVAIILPPEWLSMATLSWLRMFQISGSLLPTRLSPLRSGILCRSHGRNVCWFTDVEAKWISYEEHEGRKYEQIKGKQVTIRHNNE